MLHELSLSNLGVIAEARLTLGTGLTVVTGETGAGKTMVLTGLSMVTGGKVAPALVRADAEHALAEAIVDVPNDGAIATLLEEAGAVRNEDGTVVISRSVGAQTRSRTVVGGRQVPQGSLADCADDLVTVHGQADQIRLRSAAKQRDTLDDFAGEAHRNVVAQYRENYAALAALREELATMQQGAEAESTAVRHMRDDLEAIAEVDPQPNEDKELQAEAAVLENAEALRRGASQAQQAIAGEQEGSVLEALAGAQRALAESVALDESLGAVDKTLTDAQYALADAASELGRYLEGLSADPGRLDVVQQRRSSLAQIQRRLGRDLEGVFAYAKEAASRIAEHDSWDDRLAEKSAEISRLESQAADLGERISAARRAAAETLATTVNSELAHLAMATARFDISVTSAEAGPYGADRVEMTLAAHPGAQPRPVAEAASGGELSRIMLAIEVALAQGNVDPGHTFVFDEVVAGVGGKAAIAVGRRLAELARTQQVLVVTHLAQVASFANHHVVVTKDTSGEVTTSQVREVTGDERINEIARLLSGQEDSTTARAHALELLEGSAIAP